MTAPLVLITGASSGIGQALAARYGAAGWRLALMARRGEPMQAWVRAQGLDASRVAIHVVDVADLEAMAQAARRCLLEQGLPDVVIANAGISHGVDPAEAGDLAVLRETLAVNVVGLAATFQPFIEGMRRRGSGTLVGVASVAAVRGLPGHGAYSASKAAAVAYCESLRADCRAHGVRVVTLLPGYVATPLTARNPFPMPFLLSAEAFAERAYRAIATGSSYRVIPWPMAVVAMLLRLLPNALFDRLVAGRGRKPRRG